MSGITPRLSLYKPAEGDGLDNSLTWFDQMNENLDKLDAAVPMKGRVHVLASTPSLAYYERCELNVPFNESCEMITVISDHPCMITAYGNAAARAADADRPYTQLPVAGMGLMGEVETYLPDHLTNDWSPAPFFHNSDAIPNPTAYLAVRNMDPGYTGPINLDFVNLPQEQFTPSGPMGPTGERGFPGANGVDGRTIHFGVVNPTPSDGADGDLFINKATWTAFGPKAASAWPAGVSLVGPAGTPGTNGTNGMNGLDGKSIRYGTVDPTGSDGVDGEFFINKATWFIFGPKASGAWPAGVSLVGPAGSGGGISISTIAGLPDGSAGTFAFATNLIETCGAPFYSDGTRAVFRATPPSSRSGSTLRVTSWQGLHQPVELGTTYNTCQYSEDQTQAWWGKTGVTIGSNTGTAPDGAATADKWQEDTTTGEHGVQAGTQAYVSGTPYSFSVHTQAAERSILRILLPSAAFTENKIAYFDLSAGTVTGTSGTGITTSIVALLAGGYRVSISAVATASVTTTIAQLRMCNTGTNASYAGTLNSGMYVWGFQMEPRATPSYYKGPTTTTTLTYTISAAGDDITFSPAPPVGKTYAWTQQGGLVYHTGTAWVRGSDRTPATAWF